MSSPDSFLKVHCLPVNYFDSFAVGTDRHHDLRVSLLYDRYFVYHRVNVIVIVPKTGEDGNSSASKSNRCYMVFTLNLIVNREHPTELHSFVYPIRNCATHDPPKLNGSAVTGR